MKTPTTFNELKTFAATRRFSNYLGLTDQVLIEKLYNGLLSGTIEKAVANPDQAITISGRKGRYNIYTTASMDTDKYESITLSASGTDIRYTEAYLASQRSSSDSGGGSSNNNNNNNNNH